MNKLKFYKVSYEQFLTDFRKVFDDSNKYTDEEIKSLYEAIKLPKRATKGSAGYDFYSPVDFTLMNDNETITFPTGIRCEMPPYLVLMLYPRSGHGFKTGTSLANTVGIIDSDYYYSSNEGHIMLKLVSGFKKLEVKAGDAVMQGLFTAFHITDDDETEGIRDGGFGSTSN